MQSDVIKRAIRATIPRGVRNTLRSPSKLAEWLWDSAKFSMGARPVLKLTPGLSFVCHPQAYRAYQWLVADPEQADEFRNFVSDCSAQMLLFDLGAHFGVFSLTAAHFGGKAIAVDPSPIATRIMEIQSRLNSYTRSIHILRAAVSDLAGSLDMLSSGVFSDGYYKVAGGRSKRELTHTHCVTLDQMAQQFGAPTHVKIDVEGHEAAVLRGAKETLSRCSPVLFLELHNEMVLRDGSDPNATLDEIDRLAYRVFALDGRAIDRDAILKKPIARVVARRGAA